MVRAIPIEPSSRRTAKSRTDQKKDSGSVFPPQFQHALKIERKYVGYTAADGAVLLHVSGNGLLWEPHDKPILEKRSAYFDDTDLFLLQPAFLTDEGILVIYYVKDSLAFGAALFDKKDPAKLIRRSDRAFWSTDDVLEPLYAAKLHDHIVIAFRTESGEEIKTVIPLTHILGTQQIVQEPRKRHEPLLKRHRGNPIITPRQHLSWESVATFNPAAIHLDGKVHILYRAVGNDGISTVGYATSRDAMNIDERLSEPVYIPVSAFDKPDGDPGAERYPSFSGGGFGGCEDPRAVEVDGRIYMTYTAFDGRHPPGVAITSISTQDFLNRTWNWSKAALISPPGEQHKNWVVFPKKINGKFAILHSISPKVSIDYRDSLDFGEDEFIKSKFSSKGAKERWDNMPRGVGCPPIETPDGWLVFYHAMDSRDPNRYKVGALILDKNDPEKVLHRSMGPVLEPDETYENQGYKAGVVYACGAVIVGNTLYVYYGGADTVVCVASYPLDEFINKIVKPQ